MKVIRPGNSEPETEIYCERCHAYFSFNKSDVIVEREKSGVYEYVWYNNYYYVYCPCCRHKQEVSAFAESWFND